jgi:predicted XRE-type DNA-binding protein
MRIVENRIDVYIQMVTEAVNIINEEIIEFPFNLAMEFQHFPVKNKIVIDAATKEMIEGSFSTREIPQFVISISGYAVSLFELLAPVNFLSISERIVTSINDEIEKQELLQKQIESQLKTIRLERRSSSSVVIARKMDTLGAALLIQLNEIDRYVQKRSTDRELIKNVRKMLTNVHNFYKVEISRIIID